MPDETNHFADLIRETAAKGEKLSIAGRGSKPWSQNTPSELSTAEYTGILEYDPTELVVTARAGTALSDLHTAVAEHGQMLGAECPDFSENSSIGGAVALGWSGPRSLASGSLREAILGLRIINGRGEILSFGGKVLKNVAGFDVSRLMHGSRGRLGLILDVTLRVIPQPEAEITLSSQQPDWSAAQRVVRQLQQQGEPVTGAVYVQQKLYVRFSGRGVTLERLVQDSDMEQVDNHVWRQLQTQSLPHFDDSSQAPLIDASGPVIWDWRQGELWRQLGDRSFSLTTGKPDVRLEPAKQLLHDKLRLSFDPAGVFAGL